MKHAKKYLIAGALLFVMIEVCTWTLHFLWPLMLQLAHMADKLLLVLGGLICLAGFNWWAWPLLCEKVREL